MKEEQKYGLKKKGMSKYVETSFLALQLGLLHEFSILLEFLFLQSKTCLGDNVISRGMKLIKVHVDYFPFSFFLIIGVDEKNFIS